MSNREFFYQFGRLFYRIDSFYAELAKDGNVKPNLMWILYALDDGNPHSQKEISSTWDIPLTTVNTIVVDLYKDDFVSFIQVPHEKREKYIVLTEKGKELSVNSLKEVYRIEEEVFANLKERKRIIEDMQYMLDEFNKAKGE